MNASRSIVRSRRGARGGRRLIDGARAGARAGHVQRERSLNELNAALVGAIEHQLLESTRHHKRAENERRSRRVFCALLVVRPGARARRTARRRSALPRRVAHPPAAARSQK